MSDKSDHINKSERDFLRYLANEMTDKERNAFEKNLQKNAFEEDAMKGLSTLSPSEVKADISELNTRISGKSRFVNRSVSYRVAAGIAILFTISSLFYIFLNRKISDEKGPVILTESSKIPDKENINSEPQKEVFNKPGKETEDLSKQKDKLSEKTLEGKKVEAGTQIVEMENTSSEITFEFHSYDENDEKVYASSGEKFPDVTEESFEEETISSKAVLSESTGVGAAYSTQRSSAQIFSGRIVSSDDYQPVPGANVIIKGTSTGTISNSDGKFELAAGPEQDTSQILEIAFIGMERQEILADAGTNLNIVMDPSETSLDEVVVTGYATRRKADLSNSESTVNIAAVPVDGQKLFKKYISENQRFPQSDKGITKAKVVLEFLVNNNGRPSDIKIIESPGIEFSDEAIRLLEKGPEWIPASPVSNSTRINIILQKEKNE